MSTSGVTLLQKISEVWKRIAFYGGGGGGGDIEKVVIKPNCWCNKVGGDNKSR